MTLFELQDAYRYGITYEECVDEGLEPPTIETALIFGDALGVGVFKLDDSTYLIPYFSADSNSGFEVFSPSAAKELTPELREILLKEIDRSISYYQRLKHELQAQGEPT